MAPDGISVISEISEKSISLSGLAASRFNSSTCSGVSLPSSSSVFLVIEVPLTFGGAGGGNKGNEIVVLRLRISMHHSQEQQGAGDSGEAMKNLIDQLN
jgi:hypothetical protein